MNQGFSHTPSGGASNPKIQSFLEALRNSQGKADTGNTEATSNPFSEFQFKKEIEKKRIESFYKARSEEWNGVFSSKQKETEKRIEQLRDELKRLALQMKTLNVNITKAVNSPVVEAGEYHLTFLEHLKTAIQDFSLKVSQTNTWLEMYNRRSRKKSFYWTQAQSKGTSFTLNNERAVATSVG